MADTASDGAENDNVTEGPQNLVKLNRKQDKWAPKPGSESCALLREVPGGAPERCELYDSESKQWLNRFQVPLHPEFVLQRWGSGEYRMVYSMGPNNAYGRSPQIELDDPDFPRRPARFGEPKPQQRPAPPPEPLPVPIAGFASVPLPELPKGVDANAILQLLEFAKRGAQQEAEMRVLAIEQHYRVQVERTRQLHLMELDERDNRARRDRADDAARHQRNMDEMSRIHEHGLQQMSIRSGRAQLQETVEELQDQVQTLAEGKKAADGGPGAFLATMMQNPMVQQKVMEFLAGMAGGGRPPPAIG